MPDDRRKELVRRCTGLASDVAWGGCVRIAASGLSRVSGGRLPDRVTGLVAYFDFEQVL